MSNWWNQNEYVITAHWYSSHIFWNLNLPCISSYKYRCHIRVVSHNLCQCFSTFRHRYFLYHITKFFFTEKDLMTHYKCDGMSWTNEKYKKNRQKNHFHIIYLALANFVAMPSHDWVSISPIGSTNLTPLSHSGLWDAVIITPIVAVKRVQKIYDID